MCAPRQQKLCDDDFCYMCFKRSFSSHEYAIQWSQKNEIQPRDMFLNSHSKFWFDCHYCPHEFIKRPHDITGNSWCPFCANQKLCNDINCTICFQKSFASSNRAIHWSIKNTLQPRDVFLNSHHKFWFKCDNNHDFDATLNNITSLNNWCPFCINKTEKKLYEFIKKSYPLIISNQRFEWCKNTKSLPFDILIEDCKLILELDGEQHFKQVAKWHSPEHTCKTDVFKILKAIENGYCIIHILQQYVYDDRNTWQALVLKLIDRYKNSNAVVFVCNDDCYNNHVQHFPNCIQLKTDFK